MYVGSLQTSSAAVILSNRRFLAALVKGGFKPIEFFGQVALDIPDVHVDPPVAARLEPCLPRGTVFGDCLGLVAIDQFDRYPLHKGDKIRNVAADRRLP